METNRDTNMDTDMDTDSYYDPQVCESHNEIRECYIVEMNRYMAEKEMRFNDGTHLCGRNEGDIPPRTPAGTYDDMHRPHDPRLTQLVYDCMAKRQSIPMAFDDDGLPVLCPASSDIEALDAIETARLAMNYKAKAYVRAENSHVGARLAFLLAMATMNYVLALQRLYDMSTGREHMLLEYGMMSAFDTEKKIHLLAKKILDLHEENKQLAEEAFEAVAERIRIFHGILADETSAINEDDLMAAAIASHTTYLHISVARACFRRMRFTEPYELDVRPEPSAAETSTWTYDMVKTDAVRKYLLAEKYLDEMNNELRSGEGRVFNVHFQVYPEQDETSGVISFQIDSRTLANIQDEELNDKL